ncbi:MAG: toll/interleukin-1 receptor domain-containing protein [Ktedonobacteraceae bacterium]
MANKEHLEILNQGVSKWNKWRKAHPEIQPDLGKAPLQGRTLNGVNFQRVNLEEADLRNAILSSAHMDYANLDYADLSDANLSHTTLVNAHFKKTNLANTKFHHATMSATELVNLDLSVAKDLDTVSHSGPSSISFDSISRSKGLIPTPFLRGIGVSETFLSCIHKQGQNPFDYFTCFISYSSKDERFVKQLYHDLQSAGVRCWFAPEDIKPGDKFRQRIDEAIRRYDKLLLIHSRHSIASDWVKYEMEAACQRERRGKERVLFPLRLDSAILEEREGLAASIRDKRHIASFEHWQQPSVYQKALKHLLGDLKAESE